MKKSLLPVTVASLVLWAFAASGPSTPLPAQEKGGLTKYEYKIAWLGQAGRDDEKTLNDLGADGWDVGPMIMSHPPTAKVIMKRLKR